jgi:NADH:ubiquinone oxidoreductase subunit 4 (subunit M)
MSPVPVPILSLITWMPFLGAVLIMFAARHNPLLVRLIAVVTTGTSLLLSLRIFWLYDREAAATSSTRSFPSFPRWASRIRWAWTA